MNRNTKPDWSEAPSWATVLLKHVDVESGDQFVFAEAYEYEAKAYPSMWKSDETFLLMPEYWTVIEERPVDKSLEQLLKEAFGTQATKEPEKELPTENSGGSCSYYSCFIERATSPHAQLHCSHGEYVAECNDIIEALDMTYAEANIFKELWRTAAARTLGKVKEGNSGKRAAEKVVFFAERYAIAQGLYND